MDGQRFILVFSLWNKRNYKFQIHSSTSLLFLCQLDFICVYRFVDRSRKEGGHGWMGGRLGLATTARTLLDILVDVVLFKHMGHIVGKCVVGWSAGSEDKYLNAWMVGWEGSVIWHSKR